jgi:hypothetical protein
MTKSGDSAVDARRKFEKDMIERLPFGKRPAMRSVLRESRPPGMTAAMARQQRRREEEAAAQRSHYNRFRFDYSSW